MGVTKNLSAGFIGIRLDPVLKEQAVNVAQHRGLSLSELLRQTLTAGLAPQSGATQNGQVGEIENGASDQINRAVF